jgi:hypothetical protein
MEYYLRHLWRMSRGGRDEGDRRRHVAEVITRRAKQIETRWLTRVVEEANVGGVNITELRDCIPEYLKRIAEDLARKTEPGAQRGVSLWPALAREHGLMRVQLGFNIEQLMREFIALRRAVFEEVREDLREDGVAIEPTCWNSSKGACWRQCARTSSRATTATGAGRPSTSRSWRTSYVRP